MDKSAISMDDQVQQRLDAFVRGECNPGTFLQEVLCLSETTPDFVWDVLSLTDQYYRRGKLSVEMFETVRYGVERHLLRAPDSDPIRDYADSSVATEVCSGMVGGGVPAPQIAVLDARASARQYRMRMAALAEFGQRARSVFANTRCTVGVWHVRARRYLRRWRPSRSFQSLAVTTVSLGVAALLAPQDFLKFRDVGNTVLPIAAGVVIPPAAAVAIPQASDPGEISLSAEEYVVPPGRASAQIEVRRTSGARGEVSFVWWTRSSRGARAGQDYVSRTSQTAHFLDGVDAVELSVPILANPWRKHTELFYVVIGKPGNGASLGSVRRASVFIMRPDP